jgi:hypothetical protein
MVTLSKQGWSKGEQGYEVRAEDDGTVSLGAHDGFEGIDLNMTPEEARTLAHALLDAAFELEQSA